MDHQLEAPKQIKQKYKLTSICIKTNSSQETFSMLQYIQRQCDLDTFSLLLNAQQRPLQIQPETNLL